MTDKRQIYIYKINLKLINSLNIDMSYGWLTEQTLMPKESKKIIVDDNSLIDLKVVLLNRELNPILKNKRTLKLFEK